jgi:multidrug efflux pump
MQARTELLAAAEKSPILMNVRESALAEAPQVQLEVDRKQANALGVSFADIGNVLSTAVGSSYINDFPNQGRMQRVVVQAEGDQRSQVDDLLKMHVRNNAGHMVPLSAFVQAKWTQGPAQLTRYNGYPAIAISGEPSPGTVPVKRWQRSNDWSPKGRKAWVRNGPGCRCRNVCPAARRRSCSACRC